MNSPQFTRPQSLDYQVGGQCWSLITSSAEAKNSSWV